MYVYWQIQSLQRRPFVEKMQKTIFLKNFNTDKMTVEFNVRYPV